MELLKDGQTNLKNCSKLHLINFGCKVNLYDGQKLLQKLEGEGFSNGEVFIVNTCSVTEKSAKECQKEVKRIIKNYPASTIIVTGCDATVNKKKYQLSSNVKVFSNFQKSQISARSLTEKNGSENENEKDNNYLHNKVDRTYKTTFDNEYLERLYGRTRAFIKIEDGCDLFCSFCIIPYTRGLPVSKPIPQILEEINILLDNGYKEIVLTGIHIGCYGKDLKDGSNLVRLIEKFSRFSNYGFRFRISSIEIQELDEELISILRSSKNFCPHFHLPLQSGSDRILKLMNRRYSVDYFTEKMQHLKNVFDNPSFSTDVIIGFPTETDEDFIQTVKVCEALEFFKIHIFPYSDRYITKSSKLSPKIQPAIIKHRYKELSKIEEKNQYKYYSQFIGVAVNVLVEQFNPGKNAYFGYTERYLKTLIYTSRDKNLHNQFLTLKPCSIDDKHLICYVD